MKILIPTDGSEYSLRAMKYAAKFMNLKEDCEVTLLHVREFTPFVEPHMANDITEQYDTVLEKEAKVILQQGAEVFSDFDPSRINTLSVEGDIETVIVKYAEKNNFDMIIIGSQGINAGRFGGIFVGSVARKVLSMSEIPVLLIK